MLIAYDKDGNVVATLGHVVARDSNGEVVGLVDFGAHEALGGEHTDIWVVSNAVGSKTWPEHLGGDVHNFKVELAGPKGGKHIAALVHKDSGHRRERAAILEAIAAVEPNDFGHRDIRHLVGGPGHPLQLNEHGRTVGRSPQRRPSGTPGHLPIVGRAVPLERTVRR